MWAGVHAGFVLAMGAVGVVSWGMNERFQARVLEREARVAETLSQLTATLDSTADGIIVISTEGVVTTFNERFTRMFGIDDDDRHAGPPRRGDAQDPRPGEGSATRS